MSKKMLKRSLALGALMAFVITGSAMATELTIADEAAYTSLKEDTSWYHKHTSSYYGDRYFIYNTDSLQGNTITIGAADGTGPDMGADRVYTSYDITQGNSINNTLNINGGNFGLVYGGYSNYEEGTNTASYNTININEKANIKLSQSMYGGIAYAYSGMDAHADNNTINIKGTITSDTHNSIIAGDISHVEIDNEGYVTLTGNNNVINIVGDANVSIKGALYGSFVSSNSYHTNKQATYANGNAINIGDNAVVDVSIIQVANSGGGDYAESSNNTATVSDNARVTGNIYGSDASGDSANLSGGNGKAVANNNVVTVKDNAVVDGSIRAGYTYNLIGDADGTAEAKNNVVNVKDNAKVGSVFGAHVKDYSINGTVIVENNVVNISGNASVDGIAPEDDDYNEYGVYGAYVEGEASYGADSASISANAKGNTVNITGGTINSNVYGAYVAATDEEGIADIAANSDNNTVNLAGGTIEGEVYGGYSVANTAELQWVGSIEYEGNVYEINRYVPVQVTNPEAASNNTVSLQGDVDVSNAKLYGNNGGEGTGNTLEVKAGYTGDGVVDTVAAFDNITIDEAEYGTPVLSVTNINYKEADATTGEGGTVITVNKMRMSGSQELNAGDTLEVIAAANQTGDISEESKATIYKGTSQILEVNFGGEDVAISEIANAVRNDQVLVIGESRAAATAFVNQGSELVETGLDALARDNAKAGDTKAFAAVYGNASEYATGSHVKVNGWSGIVGVGKTNANGLTVGAFFENGTGNYRTYNTVNNDFMRGDGEATYNGGGFLVRKDNTNGVYTEASLRAGNLQNELRKAVRGSEGLTGYDVDTFYYGAHVGVGKIIPRGNEGDSIDVYGKFIYTHHDSENFKIDGSDFHFDSVDSERLRLGFRINEVQSNKLSMYYGAAWEYEFGGDADNTTVGYDLSTPSLGGSTMIGEVGMHYLASEKWSLDLNVRGYSGQRDGFTGSVQANYSF